ncbi:hypothetical protein SAMN04487881_0041 [Marinobacter sp. es.048]|nr:hypothetical protein SAMN04487881_0041 [Marinobacter sp. es.048]
MAKFLVGKMGLVFVLMIFGLVGCGGGSSSSPQNDSTQETPYEDKEGGDNGDMIEEEDPINDPGTADDSPIVKDLTVYDEHRVSFDTFLGSFGGPFVGLSESGDAFAVWVTSDLDILGDGEWSSKLHTKTGDISTKTWAAEQSLPLPKVGSVRMDMGGNGDAVIALSDDQGVSVFHYTLEGGLEAPMLLRNADSTAVVGLDVNDRGDAILVWHELNTNKLVSRLYSKDRMSWGSETVMNVAANGDIFASQGHVKINLNDAGQALFVDSAIQSGKSREALLVRRYDGTRWSEIGDVEASAFPYADADSVSGYLDDQGRIVVGMGRRAPGEVYISAGTIAGGLSEASLAFYQYSNQGLFQLDARWTGAKQITASFVGRESGTRHYVSSSNDSGATWKVIGYFNGTYGNDSAKTSNKGNTIYIQDGSQCESAKRFGAPLVALNKDLSVTRACVINRMTSVDVAVNDSGEGVVMGRHDAIDSLIFHFFKSNY